MWFVLTFYGLPPFLELYELSKTAYKAIKHGVKAVEIVHYLKEIGDVGFFKYISQKPWQHKRPWSPKKCPSCKEPTKQRSQDQASPVIEETINFHSSGFIGRTNFFDRDDNAMNIHLNNGMIQPGCYDNEEDISQCKRVKITPNHS